MSLLPGGGLGKWVSVLRNLVTGGLGLSGAEGVPPDWELALADSMWITRSVRLPDWELALTDSMWTTGECRTV